MKEDITREVVGRVTAMADREERAVLMTAINALKHSDNARALKVLAALCLVPCALCLIQ